MGKKLVYVLNKADLVNVKNVEKELPKDLSPYVFVSSKTKQGIKSLRERIKIEAKRVDLSGERERVQVGIIGYPNTGKSSLINLITRKGAARTSRQAGFTKGMQKIRLTDDILILDTPGVIPDERYSSSNEKNISTDAILGARTFSDVRDPEEVIYYLIKRAGEKIEKYYGVRANGDTDVLIEEVGRRKNFLLKGGKVDIDRTSRQIIKDWQEGRIR